MIATLMNYSDQSANQIEEIVEQMKEMPKSSKGYLFLSFSRI
jgi:hypothetical protein